MNEKRLLKCKKMSNPYLHLEGYKIIIINLF